MILETERLNFRPWEEKDANDLFNYFYWEINLDIVVDVL